ncbi:MAG: enterochelin esterase-like enzyme/sugar lactone lactonase YvrE [Candidatus Omnitrophota bacterium]|jgi:enterochelin esterase-like enzyme/sugar lactone lactonase YvrE
MRKFILFISAFLPIITSAIPVGTVRQASFVSHAAYPDSVRDYWVYTPAGLDASKPANLIVFLDGGGFVKKDGRHKATEVLDALIADNTLPQTVGLFVNPGQVPAVIKGARNRNQRSYEYDSMGPRFSEFLIDELMPVALKGLNLSSDPNARGIVGSSSGGIAAFTVAWERPDQFARVYSMIGSFTNIRGGYRYPELIRDSKSDPKPIRVFLQENRGDLSNLHGSWPLGNEDMARALAWAGYDYRLEWREGGHDSRPGGELLPEALRWLWRSTEGTKSEPTKVPETTAAVHPDSLPQDGIPKGELKPMAPWSSKVFPNTLRDWWVYVPVQYKPGTPAAVMVFQDGHSYIGPGGDYRVPVVFDNLINKGDMPVTIGIFINPGNAPGKPQKNKWHASNRGFEYDGMSDQYARFITDEILPEVAKSYTLTDDPNLRAICGASSGGICAFKTAWHRPEAFRKVLSTIGSFTGLRGGNVFPSLIRKTERKPIRVFLEDATGDLDNPYGHWPTANRLMHSALDYMGYDVKFDFAEGFGHNAKHGGAVFPDALRWLWRTELHTPQVSIKDDLGSDYTLHKLLIEGEGWTPAVSDLGFADGLTADPEGNLWFSDMKAPGIFKLALDGTKERVIAEPASGLTFGPDGKLYACQGMHKRIIAIDVTKGTFTTLIEDVQPNDLVITRTGHLYFTDTRKRQIVHVDIGSGALTVADTGITAPNGIALSPDQGNLFVSDYRGHHVWAFRVQADGTLDAKTPYMTMRAPVDIKGDFNFGDPPPYLPAAGGDGMTTDTVGRSYVSTSLGLQVFDPTGRACGLLPKPNPAKPMPTVTIAGAAHDRLFISNGDTIFQRKVQAK